MLDKAKFVVSCKQAMPEASDKLKFVGLTHRRPESLPTVNHKLKLVGPCIA